MGAFPVSALPALASVAALTGTVSNTLTSSLPTISTAVSMAAAANSSTMSYAMADNNEPARDEPGECKLLGPFSLVVQAALGGLALLSLVYKRWRERPQRPVKVWAFDVSKQVFGSAMLHLANLLMSMFSADQFDISKKYRPNPCSFYLLNLGIDTTLGIPILILILRVLNHLALYTPLADPPESIESGHYGNPPRASWWFKQAIIYFVGLLSMKICVFFLIEVLPWIVKVGDWALRWTEGNTAIQIIFVMLLFPVIMNAIQYYIIDTFIKKNISPDHELLTGEEPDEEDMLDDDRHRRSALLAGLDASDDDEDSDLDDDLAGKGFQSPPRHNTLDDGRGTAQYDEQRDGGHSGPIASSSSSYGTNEQGHHQSVKMTVQRND